MLPTLAAQSITVAPDGTGTIITLDGSTYHIEGGTQAGANLFHSFQDFGLTPGEIANFLSNPGIVNILGRVTGGNPSMIDGALQVSGSNANLYLMNPAGMVFGPNASLNVSGDFFATTADRIGLEGGWFNATGANDYATLVGTPNQFAFLRENPSAIINQGNLQTEGNMSFIGGAVQNQGELVTTKGTVTLAAVPGTRLVNLAQPGMLLSLDLPATALEQGVSLLDLPALLTGPSNPPVVAPDPAGVSTGGLPLENSDHHSASIFPANTNQGNVVIAGSIQGEQIDLYAAEQVTPSDPSLVQGKTRVIRFSETGENPEQAVFIDARADHPETLLYGATAGTIAQIIEPDENGVAVISEQLSVLSGSVGQLESVAIAAEGNAGNFWLGNQWLRSENIADYQQQLQSWGNALTENADILLYSCFTALGATGEALIASIADLTGADVAASVNATGSANYGADWVLEHSTGEIETTNSFTTEAIANWDGKLATLTVTNLSDAGAGSLRNQIAAAAVGDDIVFNVSGTINLGSEIAWATDNLTIDGSGQSVVVDGGGGNRLFNIAANNATISNLTLQNGSTAASGGGILHTGTGTLTLANTTLSRNSANIDGGGIASTNGDISISASTIANNAAVTGNGGGLAVANGNVTLINSTLSGNIANDYGGGLFLNTGNATITNSTIAFNVADSDTFGFGEGGGVHIATVGSHQIVNSIIAQNSDLSTAGSNFADISANLSLSTDRINGYDSFL
ncbi:MAG: DUF4347 domain-containing protein, partial [Spirulina sp. SIO3F2]|nr:DUF4347 domain-containing protein [Spirulina sp. SIO3F2]